MSGEVDWKREAFFLLRLRPSCRWCVVAPTTILRMRDNKSKKQKKEQECVREKVIKQDKEEVEK